MIQTGVVNDTLLIIVPETSLSSHAKITDYDILQENKSCKLIRYKLSYITLFKIVISLLAMCMLFQSYQLLIIYLSCDRSFIIDKNRGIFLKDGEPFRYISGSMHYFRIPQIYWKDRLTKAKAAGLDAIQLYIPWNFHEQNPGDYVFYKERNVGEFISLAHEVGLLVLVRAGPYICAEWDFGGIPAWLLSDNPNLHLRSSDPDFLRPALKWFSHLLPQLEPLLYSNGGPIIMIQLENEYGSFSACDGNYLTLLYEYTRFILGDDIILYTTDGPDTHALKCGSSDRRLFTTIDFGIEGANVPKNTFFDLESFQPNHPLVNSEFYAGWFSHWSEKRSIVNAFAFALATEHIWNYSTHVSFNVYMFHGGTNFGYWNGASDLTHFIPTSHDYDAPISETGDITNKFEILQQIFFNFKGQTPPPLPANITKANYGNVVLTLQVAVKESLSEEEEEEVTTKLTPSGAIREMLKVWDLLHRTLRGINLNQQPGTLKHSHLLYKVSGGIVEDHPKTMEAMKQYQGFMVYTTPLEDYQGSGNLSFQNIKDVGHVFTADAFLSDLVYQGSVSGKAKLIITVDEIHSTLAVITECQGHINYGEKMVGDVKGIISGVQLNSKELCKWTMVGVDMRNSNPIPYSGAIYQQDKALPDIGKIFQGIFNVPTDQGSPKDTFAKMNGFTRGVLVVNDAVVGRFNPHAGPQVTLYVPANFLKLGENVVKVMELEKLEEGCRKNASLCFVTFLDAMVWL